MINTRIIALGWLSVAGLITTLPLQAEIAVIINQNSTLTELSHKQISDIYMGRVRTLPNGERVVALDQPRSSPLREQFFMAVNGTNLNQVNAYWARLQFGGKVQPPLVLEGSREILTMVRQTPNAIGYVDKAVLKDASLQPGGVKVMSVLELTAE